MADDRMSDSVLLSLGSQAGLEVINRALKYCNDCA